MEFILYFIVRFLLVVLYLIIAEKILNNFVKAKGLNKFFWFLIFIFTLSFIFGNSNMDTTNNNFCSDGDNEDDIFNRFNDCDNEYFNNDIGCDFLDDDCD